MRELSPRDAEGIRLRALIEERLDHLLRIPPAHGIHLVGSRDARWRTAHRGSLRAWGAPPEAPVAADGYVLPEILQRILLGPEREQLVSDVRGSLHPLDPEALTVVALDGSAGMTPRAPLALLDGAEWADLWCRDVLGGTGSPQLPEPAELREAGILEPELWREVAALAPSRRRLLAAEHSTGVGRYVAVASVEPTTDASAADPEEGGVCA
nr:hypothetical protein [Corynebacterium uropygiale]